MKGYRKGSHRVYQLHYHFVFIPKYRKPILRGDVGLRTRELIRLICKANEIEILQGHIRPDHVHLLLSVPPNLAPSRVMQAIKGKTSNQLLREFRALNQEFWGRHLWAAEPREPLATETSPSRSFDAASRSVPRNFATTSLSLPAVTIVRSRELSHSGP